MDGIVYVVEANYSSNTHFYCDAAVQQIDYSVNTEVSTRKKL